MYIVLKRYLQSNLILLSLFLGVGVAQAQVPNAPTNLVVTPFNTGGMLQFTAPSIIGESAITNYEYSTDNGENWITPSPALTESPLIINSGLTNCTNYQIKIRAVNTSGSGEASIAASLTPRESIKTANWTIRSSPSDNFWQSVTYGNGLFVAVASSGTGNRVMTSPDGIDWTSRSSAANNSWYSVTYGNGLFVAVANTGTGNRVMTSPDGIDWTSRSSAANNDWGSVTYGNGLFVAVAGSGTGNRVMTSPDGINWTARSSAANYFWQSVTYGNGLYVAVASDNTGNNVMTSSDGIDWTSRSSAASNSWKSVTYGNGLFVAVANSGTGNRVMTSPDGINWTSRTSADYSWSGVTYGNGLFVAVGNNGGPTSKYDNTMTSIDGIIWNLASADANNYWQGCTYGNGRFVVVAYGGNESGNRVMTSDIIYSLVPDAPKLDSISARNNVARVHFAQPLSYNTSDISNYEFSIDNGSTWTILNPASATSPMDISGLTNGSTYDIKIRAINSRGKSCISNTISVTPSLGIVSDAPTNFVITPINTGGMIQFKAPVNDGGSSIINYEYSTDNGDSWVTPNPAIKESPLIISNGLNTCTSYQIKLRAVNASGSGKTSEVTNLTPTTSVSIGTNWTIRSSATDNNWTSITYGNGLFVAVANSGTGNRVMTSPDGITWTTRTSAAEVGWSSVTYGNGFFVAVCSDAAKFYVMTSSDGINWKKRPSATNNNMSSVTYGNGYFIGVGSSYGISSSDGINWKNFSPSNSNLSSVTFGNNLFVAVSNTSGANRVMTSPDGTNWTRRTTPATIKRWTSVTYGNGLFVAVSSSNPGDSVMTSSNGTTWTKRLAVASSGGWSSITYGNGLFVAVSGTGTNRVMTSPDGINWSSSTSAADNSWTSVTYGNGLFVAVANSGTGNRVMTSSYSVAPDAPVNGWATFGNTSIINFTQPLSDFVPPITNYDYSTDNGNSWTSLSPAATSSPLTINDLANETSAIMLRAVNSIGTSCPSKNFTNCTPTASTDTISACGSFTWHGTLYTTSNNSATWTGVNAGGCDSLVTLNLTINQPSTSTTILSNCGSYIWNGTEYTASGTYTYTTLNAVGCDSVATLNLIIKQPSTSTTILSNCGSYTWNGTEYTTSGTYTYTTPNAVGCDSVATLNLTIKQPSNSTTNISNCISYTWNGIEYSRSGTYTYTTINEVGCDSVATLNLIIKEPSASSTTISNCVPYTWNRTEYSTSGTYTFTTINEAGCDSVATLNLTIIDKPSSPGNISGIIFICSGTSVVYSITAIEGATGYSWTAPYNSSVISGQGTTTVTVTFANGFSTGDLKVIAKNCSGSSGEKSLSISKQTAPSKPAVIKGIVAVCPNTNVNYSVDGVTNATTYTWTPPKNATIISGQGTSNVKISYTTKFNSGTISVIAIGCGGTSSSQTLNVFLSPKPTISSQPINDTAVAEQTATFNVGATELVKGYQWQQLTTAKGASWTNLSNGAIYLNTSASTLTLRGIAQTMNGYKYRCIIYGQCNSNIVSNAATLIVSEKNATTVVSANSIPMSLTVVDENKSNRLEAYPNPNNGHFKLIVNNFNIDKAIIRIADSEGRLIMVKEFVISSKRHMIPLTINYYSSGYYFIQVLQAGKCASVCVVKD